MAKRTIQTNMRRNITRVRNLLDLHAEFRVEVIAGRPPTYLSDLLRACVVMLHASFEDVCRSIAAEKLPHASPDVLNGIPFSKDIGKPKISLGDLVPHRDKKVSDLIQDSISQYLEGFSVNNAPEIDEFLRKIGITDVVEFRRGFPKFATLCLAIKRRHHIVHQADKNPNAGGAGHHAAQPISRDTVVEWTEVVETFCGVLIETVWPTRRGRRPRRQ
ncbi:HEPN domain-containing protein [Chromobacterium sp. TRC.1.1.SA]|uniref:HEPN domain-containing protein n=1 Tax=Chromobacterium indicum TaxID=3110228 RepID=A0ABV0CJN6_9NEIS